MPRPRPRRPENAQRGLGPRPDRHIPGPLSVCVTTTENCGPSSVSEYSRGHSRPLADARPGGRVRRRDDTCPGVERPAEKTDVPRPRLPEPVTAGGEVEGRGDLSWVRLACDAAGGSMLNGCRFGAVVDYNIFQSMVRDLLVQRTSF